jgi:hypothetical protein
MRVWEPISAAKVDRETLEKNLFVNKFWKWRNPELILAFII